jgi:hypothetical protein
LNDGAGGEASGLVGSSGIDVHGVVDVHGVGKQSGEYLLTEADGVLVILTKQGRVFGLHVEISVFAGNKDLLAEVGTHGVNEGLTDKVEKSLGGVASGTKQLSEKVSAHIATVEGKRDGGIKNLVGQIAARVFGVATANTGTIGGVIVKRKGLGDERNSPNAENEASILGGTFNTVSKEARLANARFTVRGESGCNM